MNSSTFFRRQQKQAPYLFVLPFVLTFSIFSAYPYLKSLVYSLYATSGPKDAAFVGMGNYSFLFRDPDFHRAVLNTALFALLSVAIQLPLSLGLAMLLSQKWIKGVRTWRLAVFMPNLLGQVAVGVLFSVLLQPKFGLVNMGISKAVWLLTHNTQLAGQWLDQKWLSDPNNVLPALVLVQAWISVGYNMIYFLAALQNVDQELIEAAMVDGANGWQRFVAVTLPAIAPVMAFVLVTMTVGSFQLYELPRLLLGGGGPDNRGLTIIMYLFNNGLNPGNLGYAAAVGWTLALLLGVISAVQIWLSGAGKKGG